MYGYPYNSWIYGFSYLSVGIVMSAILLATVEMLFSEDNINKIILVSIIFMVGMGLIFSYCLFVPAIFASICLYAFMEEFKDKNSKKYLKFFGKNTLIITSILLIVTCFGIGYLFVPSFIIEGQKNLITALQDNGGIYLEKYANLLPYIPFLIVFAFEVIKRFKEKKNTYLDFFATIIIGYLILFYAGMMIHKVSPYYMIKIYFVLWLAVFAVTIDILNKSINEKIFRGDVIFYVAFFMLWSVKNVLRLPDKREPIETAFNAFLAIFLIAYMVLPQVIKSLDFSKIKFLPEKLKKKVELKIKVTPFVYVVAIGIFICSWTWIKAGHILREEPKHSLPNLVGMYYSENCELRKSLDLTQSFSLNNVLVTKYAKENLSDMTADNTILITGAGNPGLYRNMWAMAMLEYKSDILTFKDVQRAVNKYTVEDAIENPNIKYVIRLDSYEQDKMEECAKSIKEIKEKNLAEIIYSNENGYVAIINR